jgi:phage terminase large subunit
VAPSASNLSEAPSTIQIPDSFEFLFNPPWARYRGAFGGRGSAKSHTFAAALLIKAYERELRVLCCREIQNSIRDSVKRLLDDKIDGNDELKAHFTSTDTEIRGANDSLFIFGGLRTNAQSIKSLEGVDIAWVEEANTVSKASLEILIPTVRKPGSELWFTWNPLNPTDPVDQMFRGPDGPPPNAIVREINWKENPWFPDVLRAEMDWDRQRDPDKYSHIWCGQYRRNSEARVFKNWRVGTREEFKPKRDTRFYYGGDWGFAQDPSVLVRCYIESRTLFIDHEAYAIGCDIDFTPFLFGGFEEDQLKELNSQAWKKLSAAKLPEWKGIPGSRLWPIRADSARPETISYMQQHGFPRMVAAKKGAGSVEDGIEFLKSYDIVVHPRCTHTIDELTMYAYKVDKLTGQILPILEDKKNHTIDSIRYALEDARQPGAQIF